MSFIDPFASPFYQYIPEPCPYESDRQHTGKNTSYSRVCAVIKATDSIMTVAEKADQVGVDSNHNTAALVYVLPPDLELPKGDLEGILRIWSGRMEGLLRLAG